MYVENVANIPEDTLWRARNKFEVSDDVVFFTKTAEFILLDVYDSHHLWALSSDCVRFMPQLNLVPVLGN